MTAGPAHVEDTPDTPTIETLVAALNAVYPHAWAAFLRTRLDAVGPDAQRVLDALGGLGQHTAPQRLRPQVVQVPDPQAQRGACDTAC